MRILTCVQRHQAQSQTCRLKRLLGEFKTPCMDYLPIKNLVQNKNQTHHLFDLLNRATHQGCKHDAAPNANVDHINHIHRNFVFFHLMSLSE
jgi:hypothetical protein